MVTKPLHPADPLCRCSDAKAAVDKEKMELEKKGTWDMQSVRERSRVKVECPDAHFAKLFSIVGIKNWEDPPNRKYKGRIVFGGHEIKTATDAWAEFSDVGTTPATMAAARACTALSTVLPNIRRYQ